MVHIAPLQFGIPGGMEIAILFLVFLSYVIPIAVIVLFFYYLRRIDRNVKRLVELQEE